MRKPQNNPQTYPPSALVLFEDEHLLVVHKPAGISTHKSDPYGGEGLYDWLRFRELRWETLATIHRLDKETSGILVFSKSKQANRSLSEQFEKGLVIKKYVFLTDHSRTQRKMSVRSAMVRVGDRYASRPVTKGAAVGETAFQFLRPHEKFFVWEAVISAGKTHQIRVHANDQGIPIVGDTLYGGHKADRMQLYAAEISLQHPVSGEKLIFQAPYDFTSERNLGLRLPFVIFKEQTATEYYRLIHGNADGWSGWYVDRIGNFLLSSSEQALTDRQKALLEKYLHTLSIEGIYHKVLRRNLQAGAHTNLCPALIYGSPAPKEFFAHENGLKFAFSFQEGYSIGLFADQRDNRRRLLENHVGPGFSAFDAKRESAEVLNTFAYTCGFSLCAAVAGAKVTSIDLSEKYLEWGKRNFALNNMDPENHEFLAGDVFDWLKRLKNFNRRFDTVILDPPTFSRTKRAGIFKLEKDYPRLLREALSLLKEEGAVLICANIETLAAKTFVEECLRVASKNHDILAHHYFPQPPDFPISREEPGHLKTLWIKLRGKGL